MKLQSQKKLFANPELPGDKSISHRCLIMAALANGRSTFRNLSQSQDVKSTQKILMQLGIEISTNEKQTSVTSSGKYFSKPTKNNACITLDCMNAGTLMRLIMGPLCAQHFKSTLVGDASLSQRPMGRVVEPLRKMCANIRLKENQYAPVEIEGQKLQGLEYNLEIASAQVKSALLLAGLYSSDAVTLSGKINSRDHTERLLRLFGVEIQSSKNQIVLLPNQELHPVDYEVPNDISAASFWIAAALLAEESDLVLKNVGVNPTRMGFLNALMRSGANIEIDILTHDPEPVANIRVKKSKLSPFIICEDEVPSLIDEVPLLALIATQIDGESKIQGIGELKYKETDRIQATMEAIKNLGGNLFYQNESLVIIGPQNLSGGVVESYHDHRIAMMAAVSRFCINNDTKNSVQIRNAECANISDPYFLQQMEAL